MNRLLVTLAVATVVLWPLSRQAHAAGPSSAPRASESQYDRFLRDFQVAASAGEATTAASTLLNKYPDLLVPALPVQALLHTLSGRKIPRYPLERLQAEPVYRGTLSKLLLSTNLNQRMLAYMTLASANDRSRTDVLLSAMKRDEAQAGRLWAGLALLYLDDTHVPELFDFMVDNEDFADAHLVPFFLNLDKKALQDVAFAKISSQNPKARVLAVSILGEGDLTPRTERALREAVATWPSSLKGYAISVMKRLRMGGLREALVPLLVDQDLGQISLEALATSPSADDRAYIDGLSSASSSVTTDLLNALLRSNDVAHLRTWLSLLRDRPIPSDYFISFTQESVLLGDRLLPELRCTIRRTRNRNTVSHLCRALTGRRDPASIRLLLELLSDPDETTRYWAAVSLKGNTSKEVSASLPALIRSPLLRSTALVNRAIECNHSCLKDVMRAFWKMPEPAPRDWRRTSTEYLAAFPETADRDLFRSILQDSQEDFFVKRQAVTGLGKLKDASSVDLIVGALREEVGSGPGEHFDANALTHLEALGNIKGAPAKAVVESFRASKDDRVRTFAEEVLRHW